MEGPWRVIGGGRRGLKYSFSVVWSKNSAHKLAAELWFVEGNLRAFIDLFKEYGECTDIYWGCNLGIRTSPAGCVEMQVELSHYRLNRVAFRPAIVLCRFNWFGSTSFSEVIRVDWRHKPSVVNIILIIE